jgi:hypothetical protein
MKRYVYVLALLAAARMTIPAEAGIFGKSTKVKPEERVPQLLAILKTDPDERKREAAAKELRDFDAGAFPGMVPALVGALLGDSKVGVRVEAAETLGKVRPVSPAAGQALEQALANDASVRVRLQARRSLLSYRLHGYQSKGKPDAAPPAPAASAKAEASPAPAPAAPKKGFSLPFLSGNAKTPVLPPETPPPPLAGPETPSPRGPQVAPVPTLVPTPAPQVVPPPVKTTEDGPALPPR